MLWNLVLLWNRFIFHPPARRTTPPHQWTMTWNKRIIYLSHHHQLEIISFLHCNSNIMDIMQKQDKDVIYGQRIILISCSWIQELHENFIHPVPIVYVVVHGGVTVWSSCCMHPLVSFFWSFVLFLVFLWLVFLLISHLRLARLVYFVASRVVVMVVSIVIKDFHQWLMRNEKLRRN